jgi:hypothetical protein
VSPTLANALGVGRLPGLERHIRKYLNGRDLTGRSRGKMVIDLFGLDEDFVRQNYQDVYQHVLLRVKPERDQNNRPSYRDLWWIFGEPRSELRPALVGLPRYIATVETAKHRVFTFLPGDILPDNKLVVIALSDSFSLGVLSSRIHREWALADGALLEDRPVYVKTSCFEPFPFPSPTPQQRETIEKTADKIEAHRKARMAAHPRLTLTMMYNVLERVRSRVPLTDAERAVHDACQISILLELHERLDEAVAAAYGWPADLPRTDIIVRIVELNSLRRSEEADGLVRWLRPAFQAPEEVRPATQPTLEIDEIITADSILWPHNDTAGQYIVLRNALARAAAPASASELVKLVKGAPRSAKIGEMLRVLTALGQAKIADDGRFST